MISTDPEIDIIIPNWNGKAMLEHCLQSLRKQCFKDFRVTVVDNGSVDGSVELLRTLFPEVRTISLMSNTGFSYAVNQGIDIATAPWILLLNNDMEVAEDCLENLVKASRFYADYHFFALKMLNYRKRDLLDGAGDAVFRGGVGYRLGTMEKDGVQYQNDHECFGACAGAALYKKELFQSVGNFDPDFFAYLEDVDFNMRARRLGFRCMFVANAKVYHIGSASSGSKINSLTIRLSTRNNIFVLAKNYPLLLLLYFSPAIFIYQFFWLVFCLKKGMWFPYILGVLQGICGFARFFVKNQNYRKIGRPIGVRQFAALIRDAEKQAVKSIMYRREAAGKNNMLLICYLKLMFF